MEALRFRTALRAEGGTGVSPVECGYNADSQEDSCYGSRGVNPHWRHASATQRSSATRRGYGTRSVPATLVVVAAFIACLLSLEAAAHAASARSQNFLVTAPTEEMARKTAQAAEAFRRDLALEWLGQELPQWQQPCPITVVADPKLGASGVTSFAFRGSVPGDWKMVVQGSEERILDSVLPHEIMHTVFATHFGRPLPRWADEGACTTVEHESERHKQHRLLYQFLTTGKGIPFNKMFAMKDYPSDMLPLYSQGYSLTRFLIEQGGKQKFVAYVGEGMQTNNWTASTARHYGYPSLSDLQVSWVEWVRLGCPPIDPQAGPFGLVPQLAAGHVPGAAAPVAPASHQQPAQPQEAPQPNASHIAAASGAAPVRDASWYAGHREGNGANPPAAMQPRQAAQPATAQPYPAVLASAAQTTYPYRPGSIAAPGQLVRVDDSEWGRRDQAVTRPMPPQGPGQIILEWSRSPANAAPNDAAFHTAPPGAPEWRTQRAEEAAGQLPPPAAAPRPLQPVYPAAQPRPTGTVWR